MDLIGQKGGDARKTAGVDDRKTSRREEKSFGEVTSVDARQWSNSSPFLELDRRH